MTVAIQSDPVGSKQSKIQQWKNWTRNVAGFWNLKHWVRRRLLKQQKKVSWCTRGFVFKINKTGFEYFDPVSIIFDDKNNYISGWPNRYFGWNEIPGKCVVHQTSGAHHIHFAKSHNNLKPFEYSWDYVMIWRKDHKRWFAWQCSWWFVCVNSDSNTQ